MAIVQISKIQQRRGLQQDLPALAAGEIGWTIDSRRAYIGNGTIEEGAPTEGITELLTQYSIVDFTTGFVSNVQALESNVATLQGNVLNISTSLAGLQSISATLVGPSSGTVNSMTANNVVISYTLTQGSKQRTGQIKLSRVGTAVSYDEDYTETATTDISFSFNASSGTKSDFNYSTTTTTSLLYRVVTQP